MISCSLTSRSRPAVRASRPGLSSIVPSDEEFTVPIKVRDAIRLVEQDGWVLVRQKGSHRQYHHPTKPGTVTIAGKESLDLDPKTERSIRRQAGLP